jgi:beta-galactosidase/beta-glucuronidase
MKRRDFIRNAVITVPVVGVVRSGLIGVAATDSSAAPVERYASLVRPLKLDIEGDWHFQEDPKERGESEGWFRGGKVKARTGRVPLPWQLAFDDLRGYSGTAWYERSVDLPAKFSGKRIVLVFEAVKHAAKVWVNGNPVSGEFLVS